MYEIWVRETSFWQYLFTLANPDILNVFAFPQEDDIDGEHIVAFAEEDDPGLGGRI